MLQIYSNCTEFLRTIPELVMDEKKIEDIDTNGEDHYYDEAALLCMYRPQAIKPERKYKSMHDRRIDELERGRVTSFEHLATIENERVLQRLWWPQEDDFGEDKVREDDRLKPTIFWNEKPRCLIKTNLNYYKLPQPILELIE